MKTAKSDTYGDIIFSIVSAKKMLLTASGEAKKVNKEEIDLYLNQACVKLDEIANIVTKQLHDSKALLFDVVPNTILDSISVPSKEYDKLLQSVDQILLYGQDVSEVFNYQMPKNKQYLN